MKRFKQNRLILAFLILAFTCILIPTNTQAASKKKKALKAYKNLLSASTIGDDICYGLPASEFKFSVIYIDNNSIPELLLYNTENGWGSVGDSILYTYNKGKVVRTVLRTNGGFKYVKKKGLITYKYINELGSGIARYKYKKGTLKTCTKKQFKKIAKNKKIKKPKYHMNTAKNRKKYLK